MSETNMLRASPYIGYSQSISIFSSTELTAFTAFFVTRALLAYFTMSHIRKQIYICLYISVSPVSLQSNIKPLIVP
jgi:hypothetical protein